VIHFTKSNIPLVIVFTMSALFVIVFTTCQPLRVLSLPPCANVDVEEVVVWWGVCVVCGGGYGVGVGCV